eukprot:scaffold58716_cov19-Tisochrysis_lutea.AAC.3
MSLSCSHTRHTLFQRSAVAPSVPSPPLARHLLVPLCAPARRALQQRPAGVVAGAVQERKHTCLPTDRTPDAAGGAGWQQ